MFDFIKRLRCFLKWANVLLFLQCSCNVRFYKNIINVGLRYYYRHYLHGWIAYLWYKVVSFFSNISSNNFCGFNLKYNSDEKSYTPDFWLEKFDLYLEVKGFWWGNDKAKMQAVISQHPDKKLIIIEKLEYEKILRGELVW